mmetsp:Transcript_11516/g.13094  ORF Transcript_11516/g.13094 Transcript_11516/m.13094 type:complete len:96 (-) Transcript_11516:211-498(-)
MPKLSDLFKSFMPVAKEIELEEVSESLVETFKELIKREDVVKGVLDSFNVTRMKLKSKNDKFILKVTALSDQFKEFKKSQDMYSFSYIMKEFKKR